MAVACSAKKNFYFCSRYSNFYVLISIIIVLGFCYFYYFNEVSELESSRICLAKAFEKVSSDNFDTEWMKLNNTVDRCVKSYVETIVIERFPNNDETKFGILPKILDDSKKCNLITLGIGRDVSAEKQISKKLKDCKFLGIDPDYKESGYMYISDLRGLYVQGKIGAFANENGVNEIPKYSFKDFIDKFYAHKTLEFLLMDIESDEVALMKELIGYPEKYPTICQINVEYHNPADTKGYRFFADMIRSLQNGPYMPLKVEPFTEGNFNRIFFVNYNDRYCRDKFL